MELLDLYEGVAGGNTPPRVYVVICIESLKKGFVIFQGIFAIVKLCINKVGRELLRSVINSKNKLTPHKDIIGPQYIYATDTT